MRLQESRAQTPDPGECDIIDICCFDPLRGVVTQQQITNTDGVKMFPGRTHLRDALLLQTRSWSFQEGL